MYDITHATPELFAALAAAQGEIENASKNQVNGAFSKGPNAKPSYADLAEVLNTIRHVFAKHGLSVIQAPAYDGSLAHVTTILAHAGGGYITTTASCQPAKSDAQGIGSATTYLRRYSAAAVAGIAQEDDDGNTAAHNEKPRAITDSDKAKADDFRAAIDGAADDTELSKVAKDLAGCGLPPALLTNLRGLYSAKKKALAA